VLSYKCLLLGIRARQVEPRGTTHTCPHCHRPARTFASPAPSDRRKALDWGPWLCCENPECLWNGARDYAASLNIARLGLALFLTASVVENVSSERARRGALDSAPAQARPRAVCPAGIATCGCNGMIRQRELFWYQLFFQYEGIAEDWLRHENWSGLRQWTRGQGDLERAIQSFERPGALTAALNWYRAHSKPRPLSAGSAAMPKITCPVLGIWSDGDAFITEATVKNSGECLAGPWQYEKITGASHWMMLDRPDELNRLALAFLRARPDGEAQP
jgi:pimeloyl-ACP methyl ester carboxylesterase